MTTLSVAIEPEVLLGQKAFALAVNEACPGLFPDAEKVEISKGILYRPCKYSTGGGLTFKGNFYHHGSINSICIEMVEDLHGPKLYMYPYSWHYLFSIEEEYDRMKGSEIIEWTSEMNSRHMQHIAQLEYILEWIFKDRAQLGDGTTKASVGAMTRFQQIEFLDRLSQFDGVVEGPLMGDVCLFLEEVDKEGFKTADDYPA